MKFRIFALAFSVGFLFCFSAAAFLILRFTGNNPDTNIPEPEENPVFLSVERANFLLVFEEKGVFGPFCLIGFDGGAGRVPVFTFSKNAALSYGGVRVPAGELCAAVSPEIFAGTVESAFGIEISGYFFWGREGAEQILAKTGSFDYILPRDITYNSGEGRVSLLSGVQSINGKKLWDIAMNPDFTEAERCDTVSRMGAAFFNRRLKRFLPESSVYATLFANAQTDVSAYDKARYGEIIEVLCQSRPSPAGHITNDTEKDPSTGLLYFSEETMERVRKYFK